MIEVCKIELQNVQVSDGAFVATCYNGDSSNTVHLKKIICKFKLTSYFLK